MNGTSWVPWALINYVRADYMVKAWDTLFKPSGEFGDIPEHVQGSITSEFFVTRDRCTDPGLIDAFQYISSSVKKLLQSLAWGSKRLLHLDQ